MPIDVLIGASNESQRAALAAALHRQFGTRFACSAIPVTSVLACAAESHPDVVLLDSDRCRDSTFDVLSEVRGVSPASRVFVLLPGTTQQLVVELAKKSACSVLPAGEHPLADSAPAVQVGEAWFGRDALIDAFNTLFHGVPLKDLPDSGLLTHREVEVLNLIGTGLTNKEIARRLVISDKTVKTHLHNIYLKLHRSGRYKAFLAQLPPGAASGGVANHLP